jgi:hypothetical protein
VRNRLLIDSEETGASSKDTTVQSESIINNCVYNKDALKAMLLKIMILS